MRLLPEALAQSGIGHEGVIRTCMPRASAPRTTPSTVPQRVCG